MSQFQREQGLPRTAQLDPQTLGRLTRGSSAGASQSISGQNPGTPQTMTPQNPATQNSPTIAGSH